MSRLPELERQLSQFEFNAVLRLLDCANPDRPRLGQSRSLAEDPLRIGQEPHTIFAPAALASWEAASEGKPARLQVYRLGLFGPNGPLPLHISEYARDRLRKFRDRTWSRFTDIFHHRMLCLFHRAWANGRPVVNFDRPAEDRFRTYVGSLIGLAEVSQRDRDDLPDLAKLHHAGTLGSGSRHADGLSAALSDYFEVPVRVEEFIGEWIDLPEASVTRLGRSRTTCTLGVTTLVGGRVWGCQHRFRLVFGPLSLPQYERLLPDAGSSGRITAWVRNYVGDAMSWDVNLVLDKTKVPSLRLGGTTRLGWTTWLTDRQPEAHPRDLRLSPRSGVHGRSTPGWVPDSPQAQS